MQGLNLEATCKLFRAIWRLVRTLIGLGATTLQCMMISLRPRRSLAAENLFLREQLALFQERDIKPRRADDATRAALVWLSRAFQQCREAIPADHSYGYLIRDRDAKFSRRLDESLRRMRLQVLKTPVRSPTANAICERTIGTIRRECLDILVPLGERHLYKTLAGWIRHFNAARPHSALSPGIPDPPITLPAKLQPQRHKLPSGSRVNTRPVLGGLHHEYALQLAA